MGEKGLAFRRSLKEKGPPTSRPSLFLCSKRNFVVEHVTHVGSRIFDLRAELVRGKFVCSVGVLLRRLDEPDLHEQRIVLCLLDVAGRGKIRNLDPTVRAIGV